MSLRIKALLLAASLGLGAVAVVWVRHAGSGDAPGSARPGARAIELRASMRKLWVDNVLWMRKYLVAATSGSPGAKAAAARLALHQERLGRALAPEASAAVGAKLTDLLKSRAGIADEVVAAARARSESALASAAARWHRNARDISALLAVVNPARWDRETLLGSLDEHGRLTTREIVARVDGSAADDAAAFAQSVERAISTGDALAAGAAKCAPKPR